MRRVLTIAAVLMSPAVLMSAAVLLSACASTGPLRDTPGYATIEDCDAAVVDLAAGLTFTGCLRIVASDAGTSRLPLPAVDDVVLLGPAILSSGCDAVDCRLPLATSTPYREGDRERFWTPLVRAGETGEIGADNERFLQLVFTDGVVAARMCLRKRGDRFVGDTAKHSGLDGVARDRGSIVAERVACDEAAVGAATRVWQQQSKRR